MSGDVWAAIRIAALVSTLGAAVGWLAVANHERRVGGPDVHLGMCAKSARAWAVLDSDTGLVLERCGPGGCEDVAARWWP